MSNNNDFQDKSKFPKVRFMWSGINYRSWNLFPQRMCTNASWITIMKNLWNLYCTKFTLNGQIVSHQKKKGTFWKYFSPTQITLVLSWLLAIVLYPARCMMMSASFPTMSSCKYWNIWLPLFWTISSSECLKWFKTRLNQPSLLCTQKTVFWLGLCCQLWVLFHSYWPTDSGLNIPHKFLHNLKHSMT